MQLAQRRWVARGIQTGLVVLALVFVGAWFWRKIPGREIREELHNRIETQVSAPTSHELAQGDLQIFSRDSALDVLLKGNQVLAGLSPKTVARVRAEIDQSAKGETSGIGGSIATLVKGTVSNAIGIHASYPVSEIQEIRYENGQIVLVRREKGTTRLFGDTKVNGREVSKTFSDEDVRRLAEAVEARRRQLAGLSPRP